MKSKNMKIKVLDFFFHVIIIYRKRFYMKKLIKNIILIISLVVYFYMINIRKVYLSDKSYLKVIILVLLVCLMLYIYGLIENKNKVYKNNLNIYIVLYFMILISVTFYIGRTKLKFYNWWYSGQYEPFQMIISELKYGTFEEISRNVIGNAIMLIPLSFLLMLKDKKYNNVLRQLLIVLPITGAIEVLQAFTHTGAFDIDDIILNYFGTLIFTFLITRFHLIDKIRKLFYQDFKLKDNLKNTMFYISISLVVIYILGLLLI